MDTLSKYIDGISTAPTLASAMPASILFDTSAPPPGAVPYLYSSAPESSATSSAISSHIFPTLLSYTVSGPMTKTVAAASTHTSLPPATYFAANGSALTTALPSSRLVAPGPATTLATTGFMGNMTTSSTVPAPTFNPGNAAAPPSMIITKQGLLVVALAVAAVLL